MLIVPVRDYRLDAGEYLRADGSIDLAGAWDMNNQDIANIDVKSGYINNTIIGNQVPKDITGADIDATRFFAGSGTEANPSLSFSIDEKSGLFLGGSGSTSILKFVVNQSTFMQMSVVGPTDLATLYHQLDMDDNDISSVDNLECATASIGNLRLATGSITDLGDAIDFDDNTLTTTGTITGGDYNIGSDNALSFPIDTSNLAIGKQAGNDLIATAANNILIGYNAGANITTGGGNVCIGSGAGITNTDKSNNFYLGVDAGSHCTGSYNMMMGGFAGLGSSGASSYSSNVGIGYNSLRACTSGGANIAIGRDSSRYVTTGLYNTVIGRSALYRNATGDYNVGVGYQSLYGAAGGNHDCNTALGSSSGRSITSGDNNIFVGYSAGYRQTTNSNLFIVDNQLRASAAVEATDSILYGVMSATVANQTLRLNASLYLKEGQDNADVAGYGQLYCKDNAGTTELWFVDDSGTETQLA
jgi:hypothetical protein